MTETSPVASAPAKPRNFFAALELDTRLIGMIGAFIVICLIFNFLTDGRFMTPRNLFNLSIQTASVAIMATGMVFVIVTRNIDLSVGSLLATCSAMMAMMQTVVTPEWLGLGLNHPLTMPIAILVGVMTGLVIGAFQGWLIGYLTIPAFIVTLGGFLVWRNVSWHLTKGQTIGPLDANFQLFGGINGTLGEFWSWIIAAIAIMASFYALFRSRRNKVLHEFPVKPVWAEVIIGLIIAGAIAGFVAVLNAYEIPTARLQRMFEARGEIMPEGLVQGYGLPISVLVLIVIAITMTVIAQRTRLGRYIFATGGNPEAAALAGINTRLLTVKIFAIMGVLCAISAVVASSRQTFHSNDIGTLDELRVIAAAVIGGTALAGGMGTIYGAILGALIMQSLQSGMAMVGVDAPYQNMVVGSVLVLAVFIDIVYRRRTGDKT
ncbi:MAG: sugar ABC transporter permease [Hoeflea sp.]|uniref:sugar ABC transporter permease n=1 Tax=Hoeflea sp. TaxID=1940281 RepID=UPI001D63D5B3|nr:sugar ABC transporter permease [Hoeflea sp.]MBU4529088.1 sugar ABC transporter permease [Alphaproteobacteria bacterium]MBU4543493.1 sugar ABC transporter permease [Alphaproteobacteria bacterium]MBU4549118.1 sugar ABC transporter permease [Alphaproteobacteria bacterium]MBV1725253.1 sugar ABC transporter permease [Hoeflea sp.]MBV1785214.1 sugar ABC transporter permease [Hoeflea sp.]